jgi:hypothetical protein
MRVGTRHSVTSNKSRVSLKKLTLLSDLPPLFIYLDLYQIEIFGMIVIIQLGSRRSYMFQWPSESEAQNLSIDITLFWSGDRDS